MRTSLWFLLLSTATVAIHQILSAALSSSFSVETGFVKDLSEKEVIVGPRSHRFPSREERVKVYMSNWYIPPCRSYEDGFFLYKYNKHKQSEGAGGGWTATNVQLLIREKQKDQAAITANGTNTVLQLESTVEPDKAFFMDRDTMLDCCTTTSTTTAADSGNNEKRLQSRQRVRMRKNMMMYCTDVVATLMKALDHVENPNGRYYDEDEQHDDDKKNSRRQKPPPTPTPPTILQFGDLKHSHVYGYLNVPHFKKFRSAAASKGDLESVTTTTTSSSSKSHCYSTARDRLATVHGNDHFQPIVWKLATRRHFGVQLQTVYSQDTPWEHKKSMAVFRGQLTGSVDVYDKRKSDQENCWNMRRCRFVYTHSNSSLIHARLTSTRKRIPDTLNGVNLTGPSVPIRSLLQFKGIIMLEGNDVASGLKWALLSQSVVLMPPPKHTSWALEELLEPWVHYVPLNEHGTDAETKMQWVLDHDDAAEQIAQRGTLWIQDLVFHPDADQDDRLIQEEIIRRYQAHFFAAAAAPHQESY